MEVLNLQKGDLLNLTKNYSKLNSIDLGLGWDASTKGSSWDLDVSALIVDENNDIINTVYYGNLKGDGIRLNGDNLTGIGNGDDEIITIELNSIPCNIKCIGIFVNIFGANGRDFSQVKNAYIRMVNNDSHEEVCKYKLNESGKGYSAFHFANLERVNGEWRFKAVGEGTNGSISSLKTYFSKKLKDNTTNNSNTVTNNKAETNRVETNNQPEINGQAEIKPSFKGFFARLFKR